MRESEEESEVKITVKGREGRSKEGDVGKGEWGRETWRREYRKQSG